jgi:hypothetical protein
MPGGRTTDARRTEIYLDGLMEAEERGASSAPMDLDLDPAILFAARELRAGLVRVHPSFRFEEGLATRLSHAAGRIDGRSGRRVAGLRPAGLVAFTGAVAGVEGAGVAPIAIGSVVHSRRLTRPAMPSRPFVVGGVGVASAISIGAVYVAWRWSRASQPPMVRAARAARSGRAHSPGPGRRAGVLHGILGVMS